jgi:hypothetical protein
LMTYHNQKTDKGVYNNLNGQASQFVMRCKMFFTQLIVVQI